jgi:hypothetical protein
MRAVISGFIFSAAIWLLIVGGAMKLFTDLPHEQAQYDDDVDQG